MHHHMLLSFQLMVQIIVDLNNAQRLDQKNKTWVLHLIVFEKNFDAPQEKTL